MRNALAPCRAVAVGSFFLVVGCTSVLACRAAPALPEPGTRMSYNTPSASQGARAADAAYPVVRVTLGDSIGALRDASTLRIPSGPRATGENINVTTAAQLVYGPRERPLVLPAGLFLSMVPMAGHVVEIRASPHLHALTLDEALALAGQLDAAAEGAGWRRGEVLASPDSVRHAVAGLSPDALYKQAIVKWRSGNGDEMYVSVQRTKSVEDIRAANAAHGTHVPEQEQFLVDVYLTNGPVFDRYAALDRAH